MKITSLELEGLKLVELKVYQDPRGYFVERFKASKFKELGLTENFVQDNHSFSIPKVLRGVHYQINPPQGKLVGCMRGRIWDVAVDLRKNSPTYGKSFGVELSDQNGRLLWVPAGFGHGFCVLGNEPADVMYKVNAEYSATGDRGLAWNDKDLNIQWPLRDPIVSEKDAKLPSFANYKQNPDF